jgi:hypothetical protein
MLNHALEYGWVASAVNRPLLASGLWGSDSRRSFPSNRGIFSLKILEAGDPFSSILSSVLLRFVTDLSNPSN